MSRSGHLRLGSLFGAALGASIVLAIHAAEKSHFEKIVAPVLAKRCLGCHNESDLKGGLDLSHREKALAGGDSGPVIVAGKPDESLLWQYVSSGEMPPKKPIAEAERQVLREWIARGAEWTGGAIDALEYTTESRAGYDWWSLQPVQSPRLPDGDWPAAVNPIDVFVASRLRAANLQPSPLADRRTLIRRLYFDLLGLPPSPEEVASFAADDSPTAYSALVDRLLTSPHYGERWARHWLDVSRFGESQGFERDKLRLNAWRYRDWTIRAFNEDLPYNEFARLQLAGDALRPETSDGIVATGFLVAGPYDEVGQMQQSEAMRAVVREDELEDLISVVGQTFLGLTVNCSRCHDHKFDPVRQQEYYSLAASLAGVKHGERDLPADVVQQQAASREAELSARLRVAERHLAEIETPVRDRLVAEQKARLAAAVPPPPIAAWEFDGDVRDSIGIHHGELQGGAKLEQGSLILDGKGFVTTAPLARDLRAKTLEAWLKLSNLEQHGGGVISVQSLDGDVFDAIVFGEKEPRHWMAGSDFYKRTQSFRGSAESDAQKRTVHVAIVYREDGTIVGYRDGVRYGEPYRSSGPISFAAGKSQILFGLRHGSPGGDRQLRGSIDRARIYDRALTDEEVAISAGTDPSIVTEADLVAAIPDSLLAERGAMQVEIDHLQDQLARVRATKVYCVTSQKPPPTHVLARGNPAQKQQLVSPAGIRSVRGVQAEFGLSPDSTDHDRRRQLAGWIASEYNPLFARVIVNRIWHYHFGVGIVDTPNDFGFNGGRPSHPELLDWLAAELVRSGWSLKHLQRLIVTSHTYQQRSVVPSRMVAGVDRVAQPDPKSVDADNRLLWRKSPQRLEAESLRDSLLTLSGELDQTLYGPGYYDFTTYVSNSQFYEMRDPVGPSFQRRSLYRTWVRSGRSQFLDVFDCPDPSTKTPQRAVTTTPLQALSLLNNSFVLRMADLFAQRVTREAGAEPAEQVRRVFQIAYGRDPAPEEQADCEGVVRQQGLPTLCRVVFNSNELLYVD